MSHPLGVVGSGRCQGCGWQQRPLRQGALQLREHRLLRICGQRLLGWYWHCGWWKPCLQCKAETVSMS